MTRIGRGTRQPPILWRGAEVITQAEAEATLQAVATLVADGQGAFGGDAALQAVATIAPEGTFQVVAESSLVGVATLQSDGTLAAVGEASLQGVATFQAEGTTLGGAVIVEGEAVLQAVAHMGFDPTHTIPSGRWARWSGDIASRRLIPGRQRIGARRIKSRR